MLQGHIDGLTSSGYVQGWACDTRKPLTPRVIAVLDPTGVEYSCGFAHLFRPDLVTRKVGTGWHGFRLRVRSFSKARRSKLVLVDYTERKQLHAVERPTLLQEGGDVAIDTVELLLKVDPTTISSIDELSGCDGVFNSVIRKKGVEAFVKLTYVYVLGRAADPVGIALYARKLRRAEISCFELLRILAHSDEFRSRPKLLAAPTASGFPFGS